MTKSDNMRYRSFNQTHKNTVTPYIISVTQICDQKRHNEQNDCFCFKWKVAHYTEMGA